jgi:outer membrane receptor protein involved in Fe transport
MPPVNGRLLATYKRERCFASAELLFASDQARLAQGDKEDNRIPKGGTPGWEIMNFYAGYMVHPFRLNAGLQNLFNVDYRTHGSGINGVGRSVWISATFTL